MAPINKLVDSVPFDVYCYSLDWHPTDHLSFVDNISNRKLDVTSPVSEAKNKSIRSRLGAFLIKPFDGLK